MVTGVAAYVIGVRSRHLFEFGELGVDVGSEAVPGRAGEEAGVAQAREVFIDLSGRRRGSLRSFADQCETGRMLLGQSNIRFVRL
ncbi:hypothetical protein [Nocardia sp. NPDC060249]|uniref:hypothetical protein n=1 Tax=Nocardia sp. NPDC060249 TaxID=3347082 RepID=UPI00365C4490